MCVKSICKICGKEFKSIKNLKEHIKQEHPEELTCKICGNPIGFDNKMKICKKCKTGELNHFYGKHHTQKTKQKLQETSKIGTRKLWENPEYRQKVIQGVSKPRRESFKIEQSERIKQWYIDNPEQKKIRSDYMKRTWENNKIHAHPSGNESQIEREFLEDIKYHLMDYCFEKHTLKLDGILITPDYIFEDWEKGNYIIEFYGDHWHANPQKYKPTDLLQPQNKTAQEIWEKDAERISILKKHGYDIIIIWESDYRLNKYNYEFWENITQKILKY